MPQELITVAGERPYDVVLGSGLRDDTVAACAGALRVAVVHAGVPETRVRALLGALSAAGHQICELLVPAGEAGKTIGVAGRCWDRLAEAGFTRSDLVVGVGGGAVTDLAGFVAATWLRGVGLVNVPTTLLGMVDAAVGGKTAINIGAGKNLVGAFHPPVAVIADLDHLTGLPDPEYRSGLAEVVKCGFIADPVILDLLTADPTGRAAAPELIARAIRVKAEVVGSDLTDLGRREILNYGHTLGHAIEVDSGYRIRHGEAISVGMVFAAALARHNGLLERAEVERHRDLLTAMGLPVSCSTGLAELMAPMRRDKKTRGATLRFIVLEAVGRPRVLADPDQSTLEAAYSDLGVAPAGPLRR